MSSFWDFIKHPLAWILVVIVGAFLAVISVITFALVPFCFVFGIFSWLWNKIFPPKEQPRQIVYDDEMLNNAYHHIED